MPFCFVNWLVWLWLLRVKADCFVILAELSKCVKNEVLLQSSQKPTFLVKVLLLTQTVVRFTGTQLYMKQILLQQTFECM